MSPNSSLMLYNVFIVYRKEQSTIETQIPKSKLKDNPLKSSFIFILLLIGTLNASYEFKNVGYLALALALVFANVSLLLRYVKYQIINRTHLRVITLASIFIIFGIISSIGSLTSATTNLAQFVLCIGLMIFLSLFNWNKSKVLAIGIIASLFIFIQFFGWAILGFPNLYMSIYSNSNQLGPYMLFSLFFVILARKLTGKRFFDLIMILAILVIIGSDTRSALFSGFIALMVYCIWGIISRHKLRFILFFWSIITLLMSAIFLYPKLPEWKHFTFFESLMLEYTGKSLMSGRNEIWIAILKAIEEHPLLGFGLGASVREVTNIDASAHNLYLQIALQNGYLGLSIFILLLFLIWLAFWKRKEHIVVRLSASFFIAILVHQTFEITLTQYQLSIGLLQWFIIAVGLSFTFKSTRRVESPPPLTSPDVPFDIRPFNQVR